MTFKQEQETRRIAALRDYGLLGTAGGPPFEDLIRLAAHLCETPFAAISLTGIEEQWVMAAVGICIGGIRREHSLCAQVAETGELTIVPDASVDPRFRRNPLVTGELGIRLYAGVPLLNPAGVAVGTLCVADRRPRILDARQIDGLKALARQAVAQMELLRRIQESEQGRRRIAEQEELLRTIFELEPECVKVIGLDGVLLRMNPAGLAMLEADEPAQVEGRCLSDFVRPDDRSRFVAAFERVLAGGSAMVEFEIEGLRGGRRLLESHAVPMRAPDGSLRSVLAVTRDVTARRQAEAERRLQDQALRQSQRMETLGRLTGGIAHDFNNILTALRGFSELLLAETPPESRGREHAGEILQATQRAASLCRHLLAFSRRQPAQPEILDLATIVAGLQGMLHSLLGGRIELQILGSPGCRPVRADRTQMEQVILNLAVNAKDAMPQGGRLTLETLEVVRKAGEPGAAPPGPYTVLRVRDTGFGMSPEVLARLFEPFFTTKEPGKGTGLGLSIVRDIVHEADGHLEVSSLPAEGSLFTVFLPAVVPAPPPLAPGEGSGA